MDNYISDTYGGRNSSSNNSLGGGGHFNSVGNQNNQVNQGFDELYAHEEQENIRPTQHQVPELTEFISKGSSNSAIANRMAELRAAEENGGRSTTPNSHQRGAREGEGRIEAYTRWNNECVIHNVSLPQLISNPSCSKRYKIELTWIDEQGRPHQEDINFGGEGKAEFIDHKDPSLRDVRVAELEEETLINPLHPNFWEFNLLNKYPDINVAYYKFVQENNLTNRKVFLEKDFKSSNSHNPTSSTQSLGNKILNRNLPQNNSMLETLEQYRFEM